MLKVSDLTNYSLLTSTSCNSGLVVNIYLDAKNQDMTLDLNGMYRYMAENFIERTEPSLSTIDLLRLNSYVGNQLKEILPNPFGDLLEGDEEKNGKSVGL